MQNGNIEYDDKDGLWIRPWESDRYIYGQVKKDYKDFNVTEHDVILDIGANIGAFPVFINKTNSPKKIVSFEPVEASFNMVLRNIEKLPNCEAHKYAVVHSPDKPIDYIGEEEIYLSKASGMCSLYKIRGRPVEKIQTVEFRHLLEKYNPTILKIDCEGSEFELLKHPIPMQVRQMIIEFTFKKCYDGETKMIETYNFLRQQGFVFEGAPTVEDTLPSKTPKKGFFANNARTFYIHR